MSPAPRPAPVDVLVFDSGVGGLSVLASIRALLPEATFCYVADNAGLPYGDKTDPWLVARVERVVRAALDHVAPRLLVVACNTASTIVLPSLRQRHSFPIVGTVPAIKTAAGLSRTRALGLLATPATVNRRYVDDLHTEFASDCALVRVGSSWLVEAAEGKLRGVPVDEPRLRETCRPFLEANLPVDAVVLGCTHFPLLREELARALPGRALVDSGEAIARRVRHLLEAHPAPEAPLVQDQRHPPPSSASPVAYVTRHDVGIDALRDSLAEFGLVETRALDCPLADLR